MTKEQIFGITAHNSEHSRPDTGLFNYVHSMWKSINNGGAGAFPIIIGLIIIAVIFQLLNPIFLSSANLVNLALQSASVGTIALGVVFTLVLGQIDLSVGSVSGLSASVLAVTFTSFHWPLWLAVALGILVGPLIGLIYGLLFVRFGVPSFIITLAGLLAVLGFQLYVLGGNGSINIPFESWIVQFAQQMFLPPIVSYALVAVAVSGYLTAALLRLRRRRRAGLSTSRRSIFLVRAAMMLVGLAAATWYLNLSRGVPLMFLFFIALIVAANYALTRTRWGRSIYSIGGNVEAARRAGIRVGRICVSAFILCSTLAAVGGLLAAARLASANPSSGGGDTNLNAIAAAVIGGTSLFGGRGNAYSAILGILVISTIASGLALINLDSSIQFMITGAVLLVAVIIDSVTRRSRAAHGRG